MISFTNTEIAFAHLSRKNLCRAKFVFVIMSSARLYKIWHLFLKSLLKFRLPIGWIIRPTIYKQFIGGKNIEECKPIMESLWNQRICSMLSHNAEGENNKNLISENFEEICKQINLSTEAPRIAAINFRPTSLIDSRILLLASEKSLLNSKDEMLFCEFKERFDTLCQMCSKQELPIIVEAEESWIMPAVEDLTDAMMEKYNGSKAIVHQCFQMYRIGMEEKLYSSHRKSLSKDYILGVKIVRGAYSQQEISRANKLGKKSPIFETLDETNHAFNNAVKFCISNIDSISFYCGTHNEDSIIYMTSLMESLNMSKNDNRIHFSQLYGMSDNITFNLANAGYNVLKYIPYGSLYDALPYLLRRSHENSSASIRNNRELGYIRKELKRRKIEKEKK